MYIKIPLDKITKIALVQTNGKKTLSQVKSETGCQHVINGTLYDFNDFEVKCPCRINGQTMATSKDGYWCYGWQVGSDIKMIHSKDMNKYKNVFSCCTMLKDGKNTYMAYTSAQGGKRGRTAVGIDNQNNLVLFCSKDGTNDAKTPEKLRDYMKYNLKCQSAIMLDSGGSSQCDFNGKKITSSRKVANYLCVWTSSETEKPTNNSCPYTRPVNTVKYGTRGEGAKWVQWHLNKVNNTNLSVDGIFGSNSVKKLKEFQKQQSLTVDGLCGRTTKNRLEKLYEEKIR